MAKFEGYILILETVEEVENFVKAIEASMKRSPDEIKKTVKRALEIGNIWDGD